MSEQTTESGIPQPEPDAEYEKLRDAFVNAIHKWNLGSGSKRAIEAARTALDAHVAALRSRR